jgi:hypothetical protein
LQNYLSVQFSDGPGRNLLSLDDQRMSLHWEPRFGNQVSLAGVVAIDQGIELALAIVIVWGQRLVLEESYKWHFHVPSFNILPAEVEVDHQGGDWIFLGVLSGGFRDHIVESCVWQNQRLSESNFTCGKKDRIGEFIVMITMVKGKRIMGRFKLRPSL